MKTLNSSIIAISALAGLVLVGGCCTKRNQSTAYYSSPRPAAYEPPPTPTGRSETANNMVVPLYQESINVGKREVEAGSVRLRKIVKTETVNQPVELRHEEVVIDRENGAGQPAGNEVLSQPFQEGETVIRLKREEPVVEKQTAPAGQIVVQTRFAGEQTNIQAQVRREDIDINKQGNPQNVIIGQNVQSSRSFNESSGAAESVGGQTTGIAASGSVITDPTMLTTSSDASAMAGRQVQLSGLKVRRVIGDRLLVLNTGSGQNIYAVCNEQTNPAKTGDVVNITGTIKPAGGTDTGLSGEAAQEIASKPFYIEAQKIETSNQ
jgi:uncharacterized protein (TIGR02271 family)